MVDKITNSIINLESKTSKNSAKVHVSVEKARNYGSENSTDIKIEQKNIVSGFCRLRAIKLHWKLCKEVW